MSAARNVVITGAPGVMGVSQVLARELGNDHSITVNLVTPGLTITPVAAAVLPEPLLEMQRTMRSFHRDQLPADVTSSVLFLASDAAFITSQTLNVDGGLTM